MNWFLLFLNNVYLQTNPLSDWLKDLITPTTIQEGTVVIQPNYIPLISLVLILILLFIGGRYIILARRMPNTEEPIGTVQFVVMKQGVFEAYVSKYEAPFRTSIVRALKANPKFAKAIDELISLRDQGKLYMYQMYYRDVKELLTSTVKRRSIPAIICSTAPLDDPTYAFVQSESKFSLATLGWEHMKTVVCHISTEKIPTENSDGDEMDVWMMSPIPMVEAKTKFEKTKAEEKMKSKFDIFDPKFKIEEKPMEITILPYNEELAEIVSKVVMASKQLEYIKGLHLKEIVMEEAIQERDEKINAQSQLISILNRLVSQKRLWGVDLPVGFGKPKEFITWVILGGLSVLVASEIPKYVGQLRNVEGFVLGGLALIVITALYMLTRKSTKQIEQDLLEEEGIIKPQG